MGSPQASRRAVLSFLSAWPKLKGRISRLSDAAFDKFVVNWQAFLGMLNDGVALQIIYAPLGIANPMAPMSIIKTNAWSGKVVPLVLGIQHINLLQIRHIEHPQPCRVITLPPDFFARVDLTGRLMNRTDDSGERLKSWHEVFYPSILSIKPKGPANPLRYPWRSIDGVSKEHFSQLISKRRNDPCPFTALHGHRRTNCIACTTGETICLKCEITSVLISIDSCSSTAVIFGANSGNTNFRAFIIIIDNLLQEVEMFSTTPDFRQLRNLPILFKTESKAKLNLSAVFQIAGTPLRHKREAVDEHPRESKFRRKG